MSAAEDSDSDDGQANVGVEFDDSDEEVGRGAPCYSNGEFSDSDGDSDAAVSSRTPVQNVALQMLASVSRSLPLSGDSEACGEEHTGSDTECLGVTNFSIFCLRN